MGMKAGGDGELNSEINVTPMVDVMLVLLIIFMITAPMMNTGVDLELPQVTAKAVDDPEGKLVLSIAKDNKISLGQTPVSWANLETMLAAFKLRAVPINVRNDGDVVVLSNFGRLLNDPRTAHAAFIAETPIDEPGDDLRNINALKSLVNGSEGSGKRPKQKIKPTKARK